MDLALRETTTQPCLLLTPTEQIKVSSTPHSLVSSLNLLTMPLDSSTRIFKPFVIGTESLNKTGRKDWILKKSRIMKMFKRSLRSISKLNRCFKIKKIKFAIAFNQLWTKKEPKWMKFTNQIYSRKRRFTPRIWPSKRSCLNKKQGT